MKTLGLAAAAVALIAGAGEAMARDQIRIVGSSTVFPFTTAVAERFGASTGQPVPVVESTGTGGGMKLFCAGVGADHPDFTNASRRMKASEFKQCNDNGVAHILELEVGFDGIAVAGSKAGADFALTLEHLCKALVVGAMEPAPTMWNEVDASLPAQKIEVLGPPPSSGTRDAFEELALAPGCKAAGFADKPEVRTDGVYIESGENDNLIVSKLESTPTALGVFGYSFLEENLATLKGATVNGVSPTLASIQSGEYPMSRLLYVYGKKAHVGVIPGIVEFVAEYSSPAAAGDGGYLSKIGLVPIPAGQLAASREKTLALTILDGSALK